MKTLLIILFAAIRVVAQTASEKSFTTKGEFMEDALTYRATSIQVKAKGAALSTNTCDFLVSLTDEAVKIHSANKEVFYSISGQWETRSLTAKNGEEIKYFYLHCRNKAGDKCEVSLFGNQEGFPCVLMIVCPEADYYYDLDPI